MNNSEYQLRSAYDLLIALVEKHGGTMEFQQRGQSTGGTWIIEVVGTKNYFPCYKHSFPGLDKLYVPKIGITPNLLLLYFLTAILNFPDELSPSINHMTQYNKLIANGS